MIDLSATLKSLAQQRPVFHSEADFQHALAWEIQKYLPNAAIRLEYPISKYDSRMYLDIYVTQLHRLLAIELKYKTRALAIEIGSEKFTLKNQSAQDIGRYDFIRDIYRLEQMLKADQKGIGYAILLTNDSAYWRATRNEQTVDVDFRLHNERTLNGTLRWQGASAGTMHGRESAIALKGQYQLQWRDYSTIDSKNYGRLRYLVTSVVS